MGTNSSDPKKPQNRYPDSKNPNSIEEGLEFQDLVTDVLARAGILIQNYCSKEYQLRKGENRQGSEIKLDNWCTTSHRLSIEISERTAEDKPWVPSGIYACKGPFYIHGNTTTFWLFLTKFLKKLHCLKKKDSEEPKYEGKEEPTVRTFYLPESDADKYGLRFNVET